MHQATITRPFLTHMTSYSLSKFDLFAGRWSNQNNATLSLLDNMITHHVGMDVCVVLIDIDTHRRDGQLVMREKS